MSKQILREIIAFLFRFSGIPFIIRNIICKNKTTIIIYHDPDPQIFKKHIEYLSKHYRFISLNELVNAIYKKTWSNDLNRSLVVTIDDGLKGNFKILDICRKYSLVPTIYLCSHIVNTNRFFWWTEYEDFQELKKLPDDEKLNLLKREVDYEPDKEYPNRQALNVSEIVEMLPYFNFGAHTKFHPVLTKCTDAKCMDEIEGSKFFLEELLNIPVEHFSFPNGSYSKREIEIAKKSKFKSARTIDYGWSDINSDPFRLKGAVIDDNASIDILCAQSMFLFSFFKNLFSKSINKKKKNE